MGGDPRLTGQFVRGTIYDPNSLGGARFTGYRVRGTKRGTKLDLDFYELEDVGFEKSVGGGKGKEKRGKTTVDFEIIGKGLEGKESGKLVSKDVALSKRGARQLSGEYLGVLRDQTSGEAMGQFALAVAPSGEFSVGQIAVEGYEGVPKAVAGRLGVTRSGSIYAVTALPKFKKGSLDFDPSEVHLLGPADGEGQGPGVAGTAFALLFMACFGMGYLTVKEVGLTPSAVPGGRKTTLHIYFSESLDTSPVEVYLTSSDLAVVPVPRATVVPMSSAAEAVVLLDTAVVAEDVDIRIGVSLAVGEEKIATLTVRAVPAGTVRGTIRNGANPVAEATVRIFEGSVSKRVTTGVDGGYLFQVPVDTYQLTVSAKGFEDQTASGLAVTNGGETVRDFNLAAAAQGVTGKVTDAATGAPLADARIEARSEFTSWRHAETDANGEYTLALPVGRVDLFAKKTGFMELTESRTIVLGQVITQDFELDADPTGAAVGGKVTEDGLTPRPAIEGASISAGSQSATSVADGSFLVTGIQDPSPILAVADATGYVPEPAREVMVTPGMTANLNFLLRPWIGPGHLWFGLVNAADAGLALDLRVEIDRDTVHVGSGQAESVPGGGVGFANAELHEFRLQADPNVNPGPPGSVVTVKLLVRNAAQGSGRPSGRVRFWFNDGNADSRVALSIEDNPNGHPTRRFYLLDGFSGATNPGGGPMKFIDVDVGAPGGAFVEVGAWNVTL